MQNTFLWHIQIRLNHSGVDQAVQLLETMGMQAVGWSECDDSAPSDLLDEQGFFIAEEFLVEGFSKAEPDYHTIHTGLMALSAVHKIPQAHLQIAPVDNRDWLSVCYQQLPPHTIGRFYVYGSHNTEPFPDGLIPLQVNAATAFGSGDHQSTTGCLLAISDFADTHQFSKMLDMGCGSGILAIAMAKVWQGRIVAVDNDPESVRVVAENSHINDCDPLVEKVLSEGFAHPALNQLNEEFDLIVANILAKPLCLMAADVKRSLKSGGFVILSGLLDRQQDQVLQAYRDQGLFLFKSYHIDQWATLVLSANADLCPPVS
ncbi:MAG: 50S ribosomal protein L11 methyltransferase [Alphaproteobacteria bacterium]|nr:50S ribosomal protein L11 methyltransferase [Alphaproteobacteria bacterium]